MKEPRAVFSSEAMLCATFIRNVPEEWTVYPETGGFDMMLVRKSDGVQIGIEAKLSLNPKVISQILEGPHSNGEGPDFRAVLVPWGTGGGLEFICRRLGFTVIYQKDKAVFEHSDAYRYRVHNPKFTPALPKAEQDYWNEAYADWIDQAPFRQVTLPAYVPDVGAGHPAPRQLTSWKICAIKIAIIMEREGKVTRADFGHVRIDHRRWLDSEWIVRAPERGVYLAGPYIGTFKRQHPTNYAQIAADYEKWKPKNG